MDRQFVYPGQVPLETDLLNTNRNAMVALGRFALDVLGSSTVVSGLPCTQTTVPSMSVQIGAGAIYSLQNVDNTAYSSLAASTADQVLKQGILMASANQTLAMTAPTTSGQSVIYLIEGAFSEVDKAPVALPYYNSANPSVAFSGPGGSGLAQSTVRAGTINLVAKAGIASSIPVAPSVDTGFVPLYYVTVAYGATTIVNANIAVASGAPFLSGGIGSFMPLSGGTFSGTVLGPTPTTGDNTTKLATTAYVQSNLASYLSTTAASSTYAPKASPALTGTPTAPTPASSDNSTAIATTAFVQGLFSGVLATSGQFKLPTGHIVKYGTITGTFTAGVNNSYNFATDTASFPNNLFMVMGVNGDVQAQPAANVGINYTGANFPTATGFKWQTDTTGTNRLNWIAIGS